MRFDVSLKHVGTPLLLMGLRASTLAIKFALTLFIAKYLGLEVLGIYGLLASAQIVLPALATFGINQSLARHAVTDDAGSIVSRLGGYLVALGCFYLMGAGMAYLIIPQAKFANLYWLAVGLLLLENINSDAYHLLTNRLRPVLANILHSVRSGLWAVLFMGFGLTGAQLHSLYGLLLFWFLGSLVSFLLLLWSIRDWPFRHLFSSGRKLLLRLRAQIRESWFLYANGVVTTVGTQADKFIVSAILGLELTGVYVFFFQVGSALSNLHYTGIIQLQRPKVLMSLERGMETFNAKVGRVVRSSVGSAIATSLLTVLIMKEVLPHLDRQLLMEWSVIVYFTLAGAVLSVTAEAQRLFFYSLHEDRAAFYINLWVSLLSLAVLVLLLNAYSLIGAGIALVIAGVGRLLVQYRYIGRINRKVQMAAR